jgi:hypothetical protein
MRLRGKLALPKIHYVDFRGFSCSDMHKRAARIRGIRAALFHDAKSVLIVA